MSKGVYGIIYSGVSGQLASLQNNIICVDGAGHHAIGSVPSASDYNCISATNGATVGGPSYPTLAEWRAGTGLDGNSLSLDPLFADAASGDFHLQSTAGTYDEGSWSNNVADSPCIDTGWGDAGQEPQTNATPWHAANLGMRNLGAYGGSEQGSKTPAGRRVWLYEPIGAENYLNQAVPVDVRWTQARYLRKGKGLPVGMVLLPRFSTMTVEAAAPPRSPEFRDA